MARIQSRLNEEKMLDEMFVLMEYSTSIQEFINGLNEDTFKLLEEAMNARGGGWSAA